jgi:hypothetical protein
VFELVYHEMRANPGSDEIKLNQYLAKDHNISDRTYQRGVRELLEKEFLFRSPSDGVFFVNIRFMFNGDRLAFVRSYHLKGAERQRELPFHETPAASPALTPALISTQPPSHTPNPKPSASGPQTQAVLPLPVGEVERETAAEGAAWLR